MNKNLKKLFSAAIASTLVFQSAAAPAMIFAQESTLTDVTAEKTFNGSESSRLDISEYLPAGDETKMVWKGEFKTTSSAKCQTLVSVCNMATTQVGYLTLFVQDGNKIGYEFRDGTSKRACVLHDDSTLNNGEWHSFEFTVSEKKGYKLVLDGATVIEDQSSLVLTPMNCYTDKKMYLGGMDRKEAANASNWFLDGSLRNLEFNYYNEAAASHDVSFDQYLKGTNGASDDIDLAADDQVDFTDDFTVSAVIRRNNWNAAEGDATDNVITLKDETGTQSLNLAIAPGGALNLSWTSESADQPAVSVETSEAARTRLNTSQWHTIALSFKSGKATVFVDELKAAESEGHPDFTVSKVNFGSSLDGAVSNAGLDKKGSR